MISRMVVRGIVRMVDLGLEVVRRALKKTTKVIVIMKASSNIIINFAIVVEWRLRIRSTMQR